MLNDNNEQWKVDFFKTYATAQEDKDQLKEATNLKFEHFPPVLGQYYPSDVSCDELKNIFDGKLKLQKAKKMNGYNPSIVDIDYEKTIKTQLNVLMQNQMQKLNAEDPNFLSDEEEEIINSADFPFIKLMTLVYTKDTQDMTEDEQKQWKDYMNQFITQQIVFSIINMYFTMNLFEDNVFKCNFQTPYNKEELWAKYTDNHNGICITYDFKEVSQKMLEIVENMYPLLDVKEKLDKDDLDYEIYNMYCASLFNEDKNIDEFDKQWTYLLYHKYTSTEYMMLDSLLEPIYTMTMEDEQIQKIIKNSYLEIEDGELTYNHTKIIADLAAVLESSEFEAKISDKIKEVHIIVADEIEVDFIKPEAVYFALNYPDDEIAEIKKLADEADIRVFKIKKTEDNKLFKALV